MSGGVFKHIAHKVFNGHFAGPCGVGTREFKAGGVIIARQVEGVVSGSELTNAKLALVDLLLADPLATRAA